jgi:hypothetical protein
MMFFSTLWVGIKAGVRAMLYGLGLITPKQYFDKPFRKRFEE